MFVLLYRIRNVLKRYFIVVQAHHVRITICRLLFYTTISGSTLLTSAGSGDTMCGATLKLALKNRSRMFMRLNEGVQSVLLL